MATHDDPYSFAMLWVFYVSEKDFFTLVSSTWDWPARSFAYVCSGYPSIDISPFHFSVYSAQSSVLLFGPRISKAKRQRPATGSPESEVADMVLKGQ